MRSGTRVLLAGWLLFATLVSGTVRADPFILDVLETDELRLLYFDPSIPSYADVAATLSMPIGSIGPLRARCLKKLRKILVDPTH